MELYKTLAREYKDIFPCTKDKLRFVESYLDPEHNQVILDIGCATGELLTQLSTENRELTGIDLDESMITEAKKQIPLSIKGQLQFVQSDMLSFLSGSESDKYNLITCLGNTLVYLPDESVLFDFLKATQKTLVKEGTLILQILNYRNPSLSPGFTFPTIETENMEFTRIYETSKDLTKLGFKTIIKSKINGEILEDRHDHTPFLSNNIQEMAKEVGFSSTLIFRDYHHREAVISDFFHLLVMKK
ncbi:class I SAM-dependent methyltransferase [Spirochaeta cellobiosiphila]|uniref:class I SAM-dependent methyltransferase n=1 Tax=Spirochaeta cellobiosiphila TaxID=504483 RepID=UPI0004285079|nr:class I SAM-dependent methyltransferase [Spirochaeta cellobiosiphila]